MNVCSVKSSEENEVAILVKNQSRRVFQRGFGIIEIGIVLVIVSMMLAVTLSYVRGVLSSNRANEEARELSQTVLNIQRLYSNRSSFTGATLSVLIKGGIFPIARASANGSTVTNRWGGAVTISGTPGTTMILQYDSIPSAECNALIPQLEGLVSVIKVGAGAAPAATAGTAPTATVKAANAQVNLADVGTNCNNSYNNISYEFGVS